MARQIVINVSGAQEDAMAERIVRGACTVLDVDGTMSSVETVKLREREIEIPAFMFDRRCCKSMTKRTERRRKRRARKWKSA